MIDKLVKDGEVGLFDGVFYFFKCWKFFFKKEEVF